MALTTDANDPELGRGEDNQPGPQNKKYLVLSEAELAKGYVRPVRTSYVHTGRLICGKVQSPDEYGLPADAVAYVCSMEKNHEGDCRIFSPVNKRELRRLETTGFLGGCDTTTTMHTTLAETYAANPKFYSATYCCQCMMHINVNEFQWKDGQIVGS